MRQYFNHAFIPNSSLLIPNFLDVERRVPTVGIGGQCGCGIAVKR